MTRCLAHLTPSAAAKFDQLATAFLNAATEMGELVLIQLPRNTDECDINSDDYTFVASLPGSMAACLYSKKDKGEKKPLATFLQLASEAWTWLPPAITTGSTSLEIVSWLDFSDQDWVHLLWYQKRWYFDREGTRADVDGTLIELGDVEICAFQESARLIYNLRLNTSAPAACSWLESKLSCVEVPGNDAIDSLASDPPYLALLLDDSSRTVRRGPKSVRFDKKDKAWRLLRELCKAGPSGESREVLMSVIWDKPVIENNLDQLKGKLQTILMPLAVDVTSDRRGVWKLEALPGQF